MDVVRLRQSAVRLELTEDDGCLELINEVIGATNRSNDREKLSYSYTGNDGKRETRRRSDALVVRNLRKQHLQSGEILRCVRRQNASGRDPLKAERERERERGTKERWNKALSGVRAEA